MRLRGVLALFWGVGGGEAAGRRHPPPSGPQRRLQGAGRCVPSCSSSSPRGQGAGRPTMFPVAHATSASPRYGVSRAFAAPSLADGAPCRPGLALPPLPRRGLFCWHPGGGLHALFRPLRVYVSRHPQPLPPLVSLGAPYGFGQRLLVRERAHDLKARVPRCVDVVDLALLPHGVKSRVLQAHHQRLDLGLVCELFLVLCYNQAEGVFSVLSHLCNGLLVGLVLFLFLRFLIPRLRPCHRQYAVCVQFSPVCADLCDMCALWCGGAALTRPARCSHRYGRY